MYFCVAGEETWGGQCRIGRRQSPIDLAKAAAVMGRYSSLHFQNYEKPLENSKIRNTGHSCKSYFIRFVRFVFNVIQFQDQIISTNAF